MALASLLMLIFVAHGLGLGRLRRHAAGNPAPSMMRVLALGGGLLVIGLALASPLDELARRLLSVHMMQHLLLMLIAAPLLVWARPAPYLVWSLPMVFRKTIAHLWNRFGIADVIRLLTKPAAAWGAFCGVILLWHVPGVYRWASAGAVWHGLMQLSFLGAALLFWSVVLASGRRRRLNYASSALYVFSAALVTGLPGALITFSRQPLYLCSSVGPNRFGLTTLEDQQLAGLMMWIPMDLMLFAVALALFAAALMRRRSVVHVDRYFRNAPL